MRYIAILLLLFLIPTLSANENAVYQIKQRVFQNTSTQSIGTAIDSHTILATYHAVKSGDISVRIDGKWQKAKLGLVWTQNDLALIQTEQKLPHFASIRSDKIKSDELGEMSAFGSGRPRSSRYIGQYRHAWILSLLDAKAGDSGSPVFRQGELVAIVIAMQPYKGKGKKAEANGQAVIADEVVAVPYKVINDFLKKR